MVETTIDSLNAVAEKKARFGLSYPFRYFALSMLAGLYVGLGILLIFSIGAPFQVANSPAVKLVMGASFGIALTLVIFAGSELFTGNNMVLTIGSLERRITWRSTLWLWLVCYFGNASGSILLAWVYAQTGLAQSSSAGAFLTQVAQVKMDAPIVQLFWRGVLCNILVCLAVWTSGRTQNDTAKIGLIFWCLFAFIGSGYEHSVANMTLLAVPLFMPHADTLTWSGYFRNIIPVSIGNLLAGAGVIGALYWWVARTPMVKVPDNGAD